MPTYTPVQDGNIDPGTGLWTPGAATLYLDATHPIGMVFQLFSQLDPVRGLPLDPPGFTDILLGMRRASTIGFAGTYNLYLANSHTAGLWSDSNPPTSANATLVSTFTASGIPTTTIDFTFNMTLTRPLISHGLRGGRLALVLTFVPTVPGSSVTFRSSEVAGSPIYPYITTTEFPFTTGIVTHDIHRPGRIRTCPRSGILAFADEFVDDGYIQGLQVHHTEFDPEDRTDRQVVPASEGTINDEVP